MFSSACLKNCPQMLKFKGFFVDKRTYLHIVSLMITVCGVIPKQARQQMWSPQFLRISSSGLPSLVSFGYPHVLYVWLLPGILSLFTKALLSYSFLWLHRPASPLCFLHAHPLSISITLLSMKLYIWTPQVRSTLSRREPGCSLRISFLPFSNPYAQKMLI